MKQQKIVSKCNKLDSWKRMLSKTIDTCNKKKKLCKTITCMAFLNEAWKAFVLLIPQPIVKLKNVKCRLSSNNGRGISTVIFFFW